MPLLIMIIVMITIIAQFQILDMEIMKMMNDDDDDDDKVAT